MIYLFQDTETGEYSEHEMHHSEVPGFGQVIEKGERMLRRVVTAPNLAIEPDTKAPSVQHAPWAPGFKNYDKNGYPIPVNRIEQREGAKRSGLEVID